jgi:uncharacterized protein YecA (UPF0149 family)
MFAELFDHIDSIAVRTVLKARSAPASSNHPKKIVEHRGEGGAVQSNSPSLENKNKIGRNDPCPCGSGKKYKKCHGA